MAALALPFPPPMTPVPGATTLMTEDIPALANGSYGPAARERAYAVAHHIGARMLRLHLGRDAGFSWEASVDPFVAEAVRRGFEPYLTLTYRRRYRDGPDPGFLGVPTPVEFGAWCGEAAARYRGRVFHYGVFNEPNYFGDGMTPGLYNRLFRACQAAIRVWDPAAKVYYGEIAADEDAPDPCAWVTRSLSPLAPTTADGIAIHTHQQLTPPELPVPGFCRGIGRLGDWSEMARLWARGSPRLTRPGGAQVPILITEHGYCAPHGECPAALDGSGALNRVDDATRADRARRAFVWARRHGVEVFGYYHLVNQPDDPRRWDTGIVGQDGELAPAVAALREAVEAPIGGR